MTLKRILAGGFLAGALMLGSATPVVAQTVSPPPEVAQGADDSDGDNNDKTGLLGLLGLAGLAGLAGLKRRDRDRDYRSGSTTGR
jgi:MYXO-CTERM domain-containing protein